MDPEPQPQLVDQAGLTDHHLRKADQRIDLPFVDVLQARAEKSDHGRR